MPTLARSLAENDREMEAADRWNDQWGYISDQVERMQASLRNDTISAEDRRVILRSAMEEIEGEIMWQEENA